MTTNREQHVWRHKINGRLYKRYIARAACGCLSKEIAIGLYDRTDYHELTPYSKTWNEKFFEVAWTL